MKSICFCMPAYGRVELTRICLRQLRRTCDAIVAEGIHASATVVADDENLDTAAEFGFATVTRDNKFVSRKFNDAIQKALDPALIPRPFTHVVPIGSDDWVDHRLFLDLPNARTMVGFPRLSVVREDGAEITTRTLNYAGGAGIRIYPRQLFAPLGYRPADEDRPRACDTSILVHTQRHWEHRMRIEHRHLHDRQIVDWKSHGTQLNRYDTLTQFRGESLPDPFGELEPFYPAEALEEMQALYAGRALVAA